MSAKRLYFRSEAREKVLRGAAILADAVRATLGPKARCVLIERKNAGTLLLAEATLTEIPSRHRKESEPAESLGM